MKLYFPKGQRLRGLTSNLCGRRWDMDGPWGARAVQMKTPCCARSGGEFVEVCGVGSTRNAGLLPASTGPGEASHTDQRIDYWWEQAQEKSWHSSWTSHGMDLGLRPLISKPLVQEQYFNMVPCLINLFSKDPREAWGHQWFISADKSTADFPACEWLLLIVNPNGYLII